MIDLTILWVANADSDSKTLKSLPALGRDEFRVVTLSALSKNLIPALAKGAVVVVVAHDRHARHVLTLGADEVLRAQDLTRDSLTEAIQRASARARGRLARRTEVGGDECEAFTLLFRALEHQLGLPLRSASAKCEAVSDEIDKLLNVSSSVATWGEAIAPVELLRELASTLRSRETHQMLTDIRQCLEKAETLVRTLGDLSYDPQEEPIDVPPLIDELAVLLRREVSAHAELVVCVDGPCLARMSRPVLVCCITVLVANALESIRAANQERGRIELHAMADGADAVIEVHDNGVEILTELRPDLVDSYFSGPHLAKVKWVRERARRAGGDVIIDSGAEGTVIRMFLPAQADSSYAPEPVPSAGPHLRLISKRD